MIGKGDGTTLEKQKQTWKNGRYDTQHWTVLLALFRANGGVFEYCGASPLAVSSVACRVLWNKPFEQQLLEQLIAAPVLGSGSWSDHI